MVIDEKTLKLALKALLNNPNKTVQAVFAMGVAVGATGVDVKLSKEEQQNVTTFLGKSVLAGKIRLAS